MYTNDSAVDTAAPVAERAARGRLIGRAGRARELLDLLDQEQPEQDIRPLVEKQRAGYWPLPKDWTPRQTASACPHTDRLAHAFGLCHSCATMRWQAAHPKAVQAGKLRRVERYPEEQERARLKRRAALGLRADLSEDRVRSIAAAQAWERLAPEEREAWNAAAYAGRVRSGMYRKQKAAAIKRARSADPTRLSNYREVPRTIGVRTYEITLDLEE